MKRLQKISSMILILSTVLTMVSCDKIVNVEKPSFQTQTVESEGFTYEIPDSWIKIENENLPDRVSSYAPSSYALTKGASSVNVSIIKTNEKAALIKAMYSYTSTSLEPQIQKLVNNTATDFQYSDFKAPIGDVFTMECKYSIPFNANVAQYYPLVDDYQITILGTDLGEGLSTSPQEVAKYIANSIKKK